MNWISDNLNAFFDPVFMDFMMKLTVSVFCGVLVGIERGYRGKPAGVRTNMLICLGSCLIMIISESVARSAKTEGFSNPDPARIAAQVVSGIGFLGAGAILRNRGIITGLTTAASIWGVAAIGLAAGAGLIKIAIVSSFGIVIAIEFFSIIERQIRVYRFRYMKLEVVIKKEAKVQNIRKILRSLRVTFSQETTDEILGEMHYHAVLYFRGNIDKAIQEGIEGIPGVKDVLMFAQGVE